MNETTTRAGLAAILEWYAEAGIDTIVGEEPRDRFAETRAEGSRRAGRRLDQGPDSSEPARGDPEAGGSVSRNDLRARSARLPDEPPPLPEATPAQDERPAGRVVVPDEIAVAEARQRARSAETLDELHAALQSFHGCNLRVTATSLVFGDGKPDADVMLIGEAPGREEDIAGVPFVGKSGQLLNRMLASIGVDRADVRVTNTVPWRPPGNRPPTPLETELCLPFVARQIELVRPKILVCLGSPAAKAILKTEDGILRLRGRWHTYSYGLSPDEAIAALPMLHPAYLLRQPAQKKLAWRDLMALKAKMATFETGS